MNVQRNDVGDGAGISGLVEGHDAVEEDFVGPGNADRRGLFEAERLRLRGKGFVDQNPGFGECRKRSESVPSRIATNFVPSG